MCHHLHRVANEGLLKQWLLAFLDLSQYVDEKVLYRQTLTEIAILFSTPDWEVWQQHRVLEKSKHIFSSQLVGKDRQIILWTYTVLPSFLAYARHKNEPELEKLLYRLLMILTAEASKSKIRFMEKRL